GYSLGEADLLRRAMGKKKKQEMDLQRARFMSGAAEQGLNGETAKKLFDRMEKFAGYGFNKGHAAPYALIAYQTGWLKTNRPVEFFAASMSLDLSNTNKLAVFYQDARRAGVKVRSPDVNLSSADFDVEDGEVLYALGAIRNVGLAAMEHLVGVREAGGRFADLYDFVQRVDPRYVNKRALENLARAGAFDSLHANRAEVVAAADILIAHAQSAAAERASAQTNLFGEAPEAARPRLPRRVAWSETEQLDEERAAVGFYLSGHPLESMLELLRRKRVSLLSDVMAGVEQGMEAFRMAGVVRRRQERSSARSGDRFAFVTLSDPTGEYEVLFPPEQLRRCREALEPGGSVVVKVRAKAADGDVRFFGDEAEPLERAVAGATAGLRVYISPELADMEALKKRLRPAEREGGEVILVAGSGDGREIELKLPGRFSLDPAVRGALKTAPGVAYLEEV
ncbi:MAG: OB-fold nucleic acid binding domain-containing protein, partial [Caulobacteraceae bacterium]